MKNIIPIVPEPDHGKEGNKGQQGRAGTTVTDERDHFLKSFLEGGIDLLDDQICLDLSPLRVLANADAYDLGISTRSGVGDNSTTEEEGIVLQVLLQVIRFTSEGTLVTLDTSTFKHDSVSRNAISALQRDNVPNDELRRVDPDGASVSDDGAPLHALTVLLEVSELKLLLVVIRGRHNGDEEDGKKNSTSLDPTLVRVLDTSNDQTNNRGCNENHQGQVVEGLNKVLEEGCHGLLGKLIRAKLGPHGLDLRVSEPHLEVQVDAACDPLDASKLFKVLLVVLTGALNVHIIQILLGELLRTARGYDLCHPCSLLLVCLCIFLCAHQGKTPKRAL
mmetsp:Transcript_794/g.1387  ORF Transcript_794/g.1387 Transcript_794/m.1387 type:complete len:334 (-) Transcript_794:57-1058(-)